MASSMSIDLPYPPSANRIWVMAGKRIIRSPEYQAWLKEASWLVKAATLKTHDRKGISGPYTLALFACRPDKRRRDLDNLIKAVSDSVVSGGAVEDDNLAQKYTLEWDPDVTGVKAVLNEWRTGDVRVRV